MRKTARDPGRTLRGHRTGATIRDVAARAGVSVASVSRVLNEKEVVSAGTTHAVREAVKSLRYVPNVAARALSIRRSHTIGIVLPDVHGQFFSEVIRGLDLAARGSGYHILVSGSHNDAEEMAEVIETMRGRVDGLAIMAPDANVAALSDSLVPHLPVVVLNAGRGNHDTVMVDNYGGARAMTQHFQSLGHSAIAFIRGPAQNADARERLRGYRQAMRAQGPARPDLEYAGDFTEASGHHAAQLIAKATPRPTAIFAANDSMAVGALAALGAAGLSVPRDIALGGFDDIPIAHYVTPGLTTVGVDLLDLGRRAFALLLDRIANPGREPHSERIKTALVIRESCGASQRQNKTQPTRKLRGRHEGETS